MTRVALTLTLALCQCDENQRCQSVGVVVCCSVGCGVDAGSEDVVAVQAAAESGSGV